MNLLERYLQAVGRYLPEETRGDTMAELRANLQEQMDDRAEELGRPLNDGDVSAILLEHGKPEKVALRYLPQRSLIGPTIFPFYLFTLRKLLPLVVLGYAVGQAAALLLGHEDGNLAGRIVIAVLKLVPVLLLSAACVTLVFVLVEYVIGRGMLQDTLNEWNPMELPPVKVEASEVKQKSMAKRVVELCAHCLWMAYVLIIPRHPFWLMGPGVFYLDTLSVTFAPVWHVFYELLIVLLVVQLGMRLLALTPGVHAWMKPMEIATNVLGVAALGVLASAGVYFVAASASADTAQIANVNYAMSLAFRIAVLFAAFGVLKESWTYAKRVRVVKQMAF
jgi:hypothetical protein